jgi:hypothetical protein
VEAKAPDDLPTSRAFRGIGQAYLNTTLKDAKQNVEFGFKSSPFGSHSHGYDANNSFFLYAYGERLFAPTGRRDVYGSAHHKDWMWETKSTNSILIDGKGQLPTHSAKATGKIIGFHTSDWLDYVAGDATASYGDRAKKVERHVIFLKPDVLVIYDYIELNKLAAVELLLHSPQPIKVDGPKRIAVEAGAAKAGIAILWPPDPAVRVTDQFDVPPRERIKVKEYHLTAKQEAGPDRFVGFLTLIRVGRTGQDLPMEADGGLICHGNIDVSFPHNGKQARLASKPTGDGDERLTFFVARDTDSKEPLLEILPGGVVRLHEPK